MKYRSVVILLLLTGCQVATDVSVVSNEAAETDSQESLSPSEVIQESTSGLSIENEAFVVCPEKRPQICTRIYQPVCANKLTGIQCITTPCPSDEWQTMASDCTACADEQVTGYIPESCPQ